MAAKKAFPLRLNAEIYEAIRRWSDDEIRSVNAQIEYVSGFSGHADYQEILAWLLGFNRKPEKVFRNWLTIY